MNKFIKKKYKSLRWSFLFKNAVAGKLVELMGNKGRVSGLNFDLSNPYIAPFLKGRFLFRVYEDGAEALITKHLKPELPVVEFGGCIGVISCLINRQLKEQENHVVVEAQPHLVKTLKENRDRNNCQFEVKHAAMAYGADEVEFWINPHYFIGNRLGKKAGTGGELVKVDAISVLKCVEEKQFERITLVVDVEGAELDLIENELEVLVRYVDTLFIELHKKDWGAGETGVKKIKASLKAAGFVLLHQVGSDYVYQNSNKAHS